MFFWGGVTSDSSSSSTSNVSILPSAVTYVTMFVGLGLLYKSGMLDERFLAYLSCGAVFAVGIAFGSGADGGFFSWAVGVLFKGR